MFNVKITKTQWFVIFLVATTLLLRSFITIPNFSPMLGVSIVAGFFVAGPLAYIIPLVAMFASDLALYFKQLGGANPMDFMSWMSFQPYIYMLMAASVWIGVYGKKFFDKNNKYLVGIGAGISSSILFFIGSNLVVWADPFGWAMYSKDFAGLVACFVAAIPFWHPTWISTVIFVPVFMGVYEFAHSRLSMPKQYKLGL
jgi:hypothetical protein